ncbi:hypothetical protein PED39_02090 [Methanomassiliicoccales archaeon LGM-RCC1]|nr:hypothetical protein PED39_02090 [Methanomassiliicoccales archaeon LGM-RCC1]
MSSEEEFIQEAQEKLGVPQPVSKPPMRLPLNKFHYGRLFANFTLVADYDIKNQEYNPPEPRLNTSMGEKRIWLPTDPEVIRLLGEYFITVGKTMEDLKFPTKEVYIEEIRRILMSCGCVVKDGN